MWRRIALLAIVAVSLQRETASGFARGTAMTTVASEPSVAAPAPFTADEEAFSEALWPLHQEVVEPAAGRLTAAGLAFALDDHDARRLGAQLTPLRQVFTIPTRSRRLPSLPRCNGTCSYIELLSLYEQSATEMLEVTRDGDEGHLIDAQRKSQRAAEELVEVGDSLWPAEHKPN